MKQPITHLIQKRLPLVVAGLFGIVLTAQTAPTEIHNEPLANPASSTKPNVMFILDDSGSMGWDFSPDYMGDDDTNEDSPAVCFDHKDDNDVLSSWSSSTTVTSSGTGSARLKQCRVGDVPYMAPQFNKQYYNPAIYYRPAVAYTGLEMPSQNAANTANWTSVRTDMFNKQNRDQLGNTVNYVNLATGYPDRVWCTSKADDKNNAALCKKNQDYAYPSDTYGYGKDASGNIKYVFGAPYYYLAAATEYCTTPDLITCNTQSAPDATYPYEAVNRWCTNSGFADCRSKRIDNFTYPKAFGRVHGTPPAAAQSATATITVPAGADNIVMNISSIVINGVSLINPGANYGPSNDVTLSGGQITAADGTNHSNERNSVAEAIRIGLDGRSDGTYTYSATRSNNVVTLTASPAGTGPNGLGISVNSTITGLTAATATLQVGSVGGGSSITGLTVNGVSIIGGTVTCNYTNNSANRNQCAQNIVNAINGFTSTPNYTATRTNNNVTITAPVSLGSSANGWVVIETGSVGTNSTPPTMSGGVSTGILPTTVSPFSGGAEAQLGVAPTRSLVTPFSRVNIISGQTYTRYQNRSDCVTTPGVCTYAEEMTNFANWYTYYRTRMQMMKSAAGRAFVPIADNYRVGFITINPGSPVSSSKYLKINDFTGGSSGQRDNWYTKFYNQTPSGSTPLRAALSRVGWIFAGQLGSGLTNGLTAATPGNPNDDPVLYSCQPNFAILSSDGYWNSDSGQLLNGSTMDNQDGVDSGYSKRSDGAYDALGASNTLADVAMYYYKNDLRTSMPDNVPTSSRDTAQHQHMTTFTLGLGLDGYLSYRRDYDDLNLTAGDFYDIKQGNKNWPSPAANAPSALDDLWHAAVNGRGKFFSASNPEDLASGLSDTLAALQARVGAGAAAATSNLQPVAGDNFAFTAQYETVNWVGDIKARTIDLNTGIVSTIPLWSAQDKLDNKLYTTRNIYTLDASDPLPGGNQLRHFCWSSGSSGCTDGTGLTVTERSYFNPNLLLQYSAWTPTQQSSATGENLVNYLRGDTSFENTGAASPSDLYRNRSHILGDIVSAQPAYVRSSVFSYSDPGFLEFKECTSGLSAGSTVTCPVALFPSPAQARRGTVYVAANDGMLHAFETDVNNNPYFQTGGISTIETTDDTFTGNNAGNGEERWAYIPSTLLPNLRKLAEDPYTHRFFADGSPAVGDICISAPCAGLNDWRTVLVAGLNAGGRGYYALDITNPLAPKALWEFASSTTCLTDAQANSGTFGTDCHLGNSYGNPIITKRKSDGKWITIVTSGYNNFNPGNGQGYIYILDAYTGKILQRMGTGEGGGGTAGAGYSDADPSGLAKINGWVENGVVDNTTLAVYGGDLLGNLWKFDLDPDSPGYNSVTKLFIAQDSSSTPQPITVKPELGAVGNKRVVIFGTGKFLGTADKTSTSMQSIYAIRDDGATSNIHRGLLVEQTMEASTGDTRTVTSNSNVDWTSNSGWFIDLPDTGERVNVDPQLQLGTLVVASNVPSSDACTAGGYSWINFLDFTTGRVIDNTPARRIGSSLIVGLNVVVLPGGKVVTIITTADNQQRTEETPVSPTTFQGKRVLWRELIVDQ